MSHVHTQPAGTKFYHTSRWKMELSMFSLCAVLRVSLPPHYPLSVFQPIWRQWAPYFATVSSYGFWTCPVLICWRSLLNITIEQKNISNIFISKYIVIQIGLQSQTYILSCLFGLFFSVFVIRKPGYMAYFTDLFLLLCSFLFICQEVTWQDFLPLNVISVSPLLQRNIWFSLWRI